MYPTELKYTKTHEWIKQEGQFALVGITAFAIEELTDLTYLQFDVAVGKILAKGDAFGVVESVKGTSDLYIPASGKVVAIQNDLRNKLETLAKDPYQSGWMIKIELTKPAELDAMMTAEAYEKHTKEAHH